MKKKKNLRKCWKWLEKNYGKSGAVVKQVANKALIIKRCSVDYMLII